ncbi:hypothetical protein B2J93_8022 [Marssonina coronariae]|uniref:Uncharacterized protein n=1 Tax=Diplocarpon coronariae TaxID=2795749 RepID=A0A218ZCF1_9HELO|nr:hypothetical protein B2J93_8022 [Marssonina coronariae]
MWEEPEQILQEWSDDPYRGRDPSDRWRRRASSNSRQRAESPLSRELRTKRDSAATTVRAALHLAPAGTRRAGEALLSAARPFSARGRLSAILLGTLSRMAAALPADAGWRQAAIAGADPRGALTSLTPSLPSPGQQSRSGLIGGACFCLGFSADVRVSGPSGSSCRRARQMVRDEPRCQGLPEPVPLRARAACRTRRAAHVKLPGLAHRKSCSHSGACALRRSTTVPSAPPPRPSSSAPSHGDVNFQLHMRLVWVRLLRKPGSLGLGRRRGFCCIPSSRIVGAALGRGRVILVSRRVSSREHFADVSSRTVLGGVFTETVESDCLSGLAVRCKVEYGSRRPNVATLCRRALSKERKQAWFGARKLFLKAREKSDWQRFIMVT